MAKFLIADDHPLFREALTAALQPFFPSLEIVESDSLESTLDAITTHRDIDLVLLDLQMPGSEQLYGLMCLVQTYPDVPVAVISATDTPRVIAQVMAFGAGAFIPKSSRSQDIADAVNAVIAGDTWLPAGLEEEINNVDEEQSSIAQLVSELTPKQFQVLKKLQDGKLNKQIAFEMHVTEATIKAHISAIFRKLNVNTRTQAVLLVEKLQ